MQPEDIIRAYDDVRPDRAAKDAMLQNILSAAAPAAPAKKRRSWLIPAVGAAAVVCLLALPRTPEPPVPEEAPPRTMVQGTRPPVAAAPAPGPETLHWDGAVYILRPAPSDVSPGELLADLESGTLYEFPEGSGELLLIREDAVYLCIPSAPSDP